MYRASRFSTIKPCGFPARHRASALAVALAGAVMAPAGCGPSRADKVDQTSAPEAVEDISSMQYDPATGRFQVICRDGTRESVTAEQIRANQVCTGGGGGGGAAGSVSFYHSDSCSGDLLATVRFSGNADWNESRCQSLAQTVSSSVWGVRLGNGTCEDVADTAFLNACRNFQGVPDGTASVVRYYHSDSCSGDLLASLRFSGSLDGDQLTCDRASASISSSVWGVKLGAGACEDISDTAFASACVRFRGGDSTSPDVTTVAFYHSDSCSGDLVASVSFGLDSNANRATCERIAGHVSTSIWGVKANGGGCEDISDTSFVNACLRYQ